MSFDTIAATAIVLGTDRHGADTMLPLKRANRHGLITGATGTGKTVTLQRMAEEFARAGVPVFATDIKGDLSGIAAAKNEQAAPSTVIFWDVLAQKGHPIRTTITEMGPLLLARLLGLSDAQAGVLHIAFRLADDDGMPLIDLKDLRAMLTFIAENKEACAARYGMVATQSIAAINRALLVLDDAGGALFFGEPALNVTDLLRRDAAGRGIVHILAADQLMQQPQLYATFLLWLLAELYEDLPEIGDLPQPKLVLFFDEAHLLFNDAPKVLVDKIEQVVRLIRSKGVGVYFVTQNPLDIPETILGQLGARVQHALRAFTPKDQKAVRAAAETFRQNPEFNTEEVIGTLAVGEALVSVLDDKGAPTMVDRIKIALPAASALGAITQSVRDEMIQHSPVAGVYDAVLDRDSAYELLAARVEKNAPVLTAPNKKGGVIDDMLASASDGVGGKTKTGRSREGLVESMAKSAIRAVGSQVGRTIAREIIRGVLGSVSRR